MSDVRKCRCGAPLWGTDEVSRRLFDAVWEAMAEEEEGRVAAAGGLIIEALFAANELEGRCFTCFWAAASNHSGWPPCNAERARFHYARARRQLQHARRCTNPDVAKEHVATAERERERARRCRVRARAAREQAATEKGSGLCES